MKLRHMTVTIVQEATSVDDLGLASSVPCRVMNARCVIDDPNYETWMLEYTEHAESGGTPATIITTGKQRNLLWNGELWRIAPPQTDRLLETVQQAVRSDRRPRPDVDKLIETISRRLRKRRVCN